MAAATAGTPEVGTVQVVLCDVCERRVVGRAYELHLIRGVAVRSESGTRVVQRRGSTQLYLCGPCGAWVNGALDHLRSSLGHGRRRGPASRASDAGNAEGGPEARLPASSYGRRAAS